MAQIDEQLRAAFFELGTYGHDIRTALPPVWYEAGKKIVAVIDGIPHSREMVISRVSVNGTQQALG